MDIDKNLDLKNLLAEVEALKLRVAILEDNLQPAVHEKPPIMEEQNQVGWRRATPEPIRTPKIPLRQRFSENFIGGQLLNRIGSLIVVFAVAYFLKWSFDNDIIGELGRCVLGLVAGIGLVAAGQIYFKKGYSVFSQGLTGAGIAIIYLSTYAAVDYYHLISPYMAFALMFITALTAGVLAAVGDMSGTAVMATIGGFLVPFLMGSHTGQIVPLLTYILILDLGILFLAYYRQWFFLDIMALVGTGLVSLVAYNLEWKIWAGQCFLTAFMLLFIAVAVIYNHRTRNDNPFLLLISGLLFSVFTYFNLYEQMEEWMGLVSLALAAIYLGTYVFIRFREMGTKLFAQTLLIIALGFSLLAPPAQLQGVYNQMAWLAVAAVCLYFSRLNYNKAAYLIGIIIIVLSGLSIHVETYPQPVFNKTTLILSLNALVWFWALWVAARNYPLQKKITAAIAVVIVSIIFYLLDYDISNAVYFYQANQSFTFLIPISWALVSSLVLWLGVRRYDSGIRLFSLLLYGVVILRTIFYDLQQLDIIFKIMVLMAIGLIALAISFFYQQRMKGDELK
ncbi:MAG: hypothetical protein CVU90_05880 [Firmicutes bacterium HGW-Firmicutes-15]|nr:MAG: hypothetical protein CVU90_05880 [Firmicutes bacterium HGW-Firmicutes-15]